MKEFIREISQIQESIKDDAKNTTKLFESLEKKLLKV